MLLLRWNYHFTPPPDVSEAARCLCADLVLLIKDYLGPYDACSPADLSSFLAWLKRRVRGPRGLAEKWSADAFDSLTWYFAAIHAIGWYKHGRRYVVCGQRRASHENMAVAFEIHRVYQDSPTPEGNGVLLPQRRVLRAPFDMRLSRSYHLVFAPVAVELPEQVPCLILLRWRCGKYVGKVGEFVGGEPLGAVYAMKFSSVRRRRRHARVAVEKWPPPPLWGNGRSPCLTS